MIEHDLQGPRCRHCRARVVKSLPPCADVYGRVFLAPFCRQVMIYACPSCGSKAPLTHPDGRVIRSPFEPVSIDLEVAQNVESWGKYLERMHEWIPQLPVVTQREYDDITWPRRGRPSRKTPYRSFPCPDLHCLEHKMEWRADRNSGLGILFVPVGERREQPTLRCGACHRIYFRLDPTK